MRVIDNCIDIHRQNQILDYLTSERCNWYFTPHVADNKLTETDRPAYYHEWIANNMIRDPKHVSYIYPFLDIANKNRVIRAVSFLQLPRHDNTPNGKHIDLDGQNTICLYYVNDSDGGTVFYKGDKIVKRIEAKKGRCVIFDGNILHSGVSPTNCKIVINMNLQDA